VAPPVHGALAPDSRTLPARGKGEAPRDIPGLRRRDRERSWQDEVRDRVRKRRRKRSGDPELPLFEGPAAEESAPAAEAEVPEPAPAAALASEAPPERPPAVALAVEPLPRPAPARRDRAPAAFESRVLERVDPLDSLADLPLRPSLGGPSPLEPAAAAREMEPEAREPDGPREPPADDGWATDAPLEPRLEPPPRLVDERPVERPAQALERAQAAAVDVTLLGALSAVVVYFASRFAHVPIEGLRPSWPFLAAYLGFLALVYAVYFTGTTGQTLGKLVYGLRVVDTGGRPPGYLRAAGRAALGTLGVVVAGLGLLPVLFDPARRAFHDRVLHTRVIRG
jgi:uncharacterized RDD family membrane protein YckC